MRLFGALMITTNSSGVKVLLGVGVILTLTLSRLKMAALKLKAIICTLYCSQLTIKESIRYDISLYLTQYNRS